jgi:hypothetical protein
MDLTPRQWNWDHSLTNYVYSHMIHFCDLRIITRLHNYFIYKRQCYIKSAFPKILTYSMEQSPSWEANRFSASQESPQSLWNPKASLPHVQVPPTCPCPKPDQSSPWPRPAPHPTSWRSVSDLYRLLTFHIPNLTSIFHCLILPNYQSRPEACAQVL